jgi:hypothetical protein
MELRYESKFVNNLIAVNFLLIEKVQIAIIKIYIYVSGEWIATKIFQKVLMVRNGLILLKKQQYFKL